MMEGFTFSREVVGRRLRSGIVDSGMSVEEWAAAHDLNESTVKSWCSGRSGMSLENACKVCDIFGWPLDRLAVRER